MIDCGLLAQGSMKGFLGGTNFNRCKRLHPLLAISLKTLHFKAFLKLYSEETHHGKIEMNELLEILESDSLRLESTEITVPLLHDILQKYQAYCDETLIGKNGHTAQFAMIYIYLIDLYLNGERAMRTSDTDLYIYANYNICSVLFAFNHQNYARWLSRYCDNFMNIENTHPGLLKEFQTGALSIRRTPQNFARSPIDLTLEQTINKDAANRLSGIIAFTNSINARRRWSETHSARTAVTSHLLDFTRLSKTNECLANEYQSKIFTRQVQRFTEELCQNINPFDDGINQTKLFNLSSGMAATPETSKFLLNLLPNGMKQMVEFIGQCAKDPKRFDQPIKRNAIRNFSSEICKNQKTPKRIIEMRDERNVMCEVLCLAAEKKIDLYKVLSHPLTTIPQSLANYDGTMISNSQKGDITTILTSKNNETLPCQPSNFGIEIIDGFYYLSKIRESPGKYGSFGDFLLKNLCKSKALEIHLIFDVYEGPSIRDMDWSKNNSIYDNSMVNFEIKGPNQERNGNLLKCLANSSFRKELVKFLINHWNNDEIDSTLGHRRIFVSYKTECYLYCKDMEKKRSISSLCNNHIEMETIMIFHMYQVSATDIIIKIQNTDIVIVYLLYHMQFFENGKNIWLETGDANKNDYQIIDVGEIFKKLTNNFVNALPGLYVYTGCRYEPSFFGKGKKKCFKILEKYPELQKSFGNLGTYDSVLQQDIEQLERFTCLLYGTQFENVNEARVNLFTKAYESKATNIAKKGKIE